MYQSEQRMSYLMDFFAIVGIIISCLGLYGLAAFATERRTKELGVRKVMGASVGEIIGLVSREYLIIVFIAYVISYPVAWYFMSRWLDSFAFHVNLSILTFIISAGISLVLAILTVSYFALKAARTNPVESLRYE